MHEHAEYGGAAHWLYKEVTVEPPAASSADSRSAGAEGRDPEGTSAEVQASLQPEASDRPLPASAPSLPPRLVNGFKGQPLLRIAPDRLRYGVVLQRRDGGKRLICAIKSGGTVQDHPVRAPDDLYVQLRQYAVDQGYSAPGQGDLKMR